MTPFSDRCAILSELWQDYRHELAFKDFVEYNDIGLSLAYMIDQDLAMETDNGTGYVNETFDLLLEALGLDDIEEGWSALEEVLDAAEDQKE